MAINAMRNPAHRLCSVSGPYNQKQWVRLTPIPSDKLSDHRCNKHAKEHSRADVKDKRYPQI